jgi:hypothetical protein
MCFIYQDVPVPGSEFCHVPPAVGQPGADTQVCLVTAGRLYLRASQMFEASLKIFIRQVLLNVVPVQFKNMKK